MCEGAQELITIPGGLKFQTIGPNTVVRMRYEADKGFSRLPWKYAAVAEANSNV